MSHRNGGNSATLGRLALFFGLFVVATVLSVGAWNERSSFKNALYEAYPEHNEQRKPGQEGRPQTGWVEARQAWIADADLDVAVWQLMLSFFGIAGVAYTVWYARLAWIEAEKSASAAANALKLSEESAERQLRAYITVELKGARVLGSGEIEAVAEIINRGQTPAKDVVTKWAMGIDLREPDRATVDYILSCAHCPAEDVSMMLGPQDTRGIKSKADPFDPADMDKVFNGTGSLCVAGIVEYVDAFGKKRNTRFVHLYDGREWSADEGRYCHYGNDYT